MSKEKKRITKQGYRQVYIKEIQKYVMEHRLVIENHLGRPLEVGEYVHHKDENKLNNTISNLEIIDKRKHTALHFKGKNRPFMTKYKIVQALPNGAKKGSIVSLKPNYRLFILNKCKNCGKLFWTRKRRGKESERIAKGCSNSCAIKIAWEEGKYEKRVSNTVTRSN